MSGQIRPSRSFKLAHNVDETCFLFSTEINQHISKQKLLTTLDFLRSPCSAFEHWAKMAQLELIGEPALVQELVGHAPVNALATAVPHRFSRRDEAADDPGARVVRSCGEAGPAKPPPDAGEFTGPLAIC